MTFAPGDAHPFCIYKGRYRFAFPILDADGDPVSAATGLDSERSIDFAAGGDCTNEATEFTTAPLGMYFLDLTSAETTGSNITGVTKTTSTGAKTTCWSIPVVRFPVLESGTAQAGAAGTITLASGASAVNGFYNGLYIQCSNDTPANVLGQTRMIVSYVGSTRVATLEDNWGTAPSSATTYDILVPKAVNVSAIQGQRMPDSATAGVPSVDVANWKGAAVATVTVAGVPEVDVTHFNGTAGTFAAGRPEVNTTHAAGTAWGSGAITAAVLADACIDAATFAADALSGSALAATAATEIANAVLGTAVPGAFGAGTLGRVAGRSLPDITAGTPNGLFIAGTNAATTITGSLTTTFTGNLTGTTGDAAAPTAAAVADAVWDEALAGHAGVGSTGEALSAATAPSAAVVADAVWDEAISGHLGAGTTGLALNSAGAAGDPWSTTIPGAYGAGTAGSRLGKLPDVTAGGAGGVFIAGTNAATSVTTALTADITGNLSGSVGSVTGAVGSVTGAVGSVTGNVGGNVTGSVGSVTGAVGSVAGLTASNLDTTISSRLAPTVAARTLDVSATGEAGIDWANVGTPGSTVALSGTTVGTVTTTGTATNVTTVNGLSAGTIDSILDDPIEGSMTLRQAMRIVLAACANKLSGAATTTVTIRDLADTKARITATVDADGNRSAVTLDAT